MGRDRSIDVLAMRHLWRRGAVGGEMGWLGCIDASSLNTLEGEIRGTF